MLINGKNYFYDAGRQKHVYVAGSEVKIVEKDMLKKELYNEVRGDEKAYKQRLSENFFEKIEIRYFEFDPHKEEEYKKHGFQTVNTYKKSAVVKKGEKLRENIKVKELKKDISFLTSYPHINRLLDNLFVTDDRKKYFINWLATALITRKKNRTAILVRGRQGTGKGLVWEQIIEYAAGSDYCATIGNDDLSTNFNSAMENKLFILANEIKGMFREGNAMYEKLKMYITDDELRVEQKRLDSRKVKNYFNVFLASNNTTPLQIQSGDRRYTVYETADEKIKDVAEREFDLTIEQFIKKIKEERDGFISDLFCYDYDAQIATQCQDTEEKERIYRASVTKSEIICEKIKSLDVSFFENDVAEIVESMNFNDFFTMVENHKIISVEAGEDAIIRTLDLATKTMFQQIREYGKVENRYMVFFYSLFTGETSAQKIGTNLTAHFGSSSTGRFGSSKATRIRKVKILAENIPF
ncbi:MAG: DUF5906 domain-containing protein [Sulfurovum sp.]|nr:DUF5906 domain-containing protein [Sulfurovum sp.]